MEFDGQFQKMKEHNVTAKQTPMGMKVRLGPGRESYEALVFILEVSNTLYTSLPSPGKHVLEVSGVK